MLRFLRFPLGTPLLVRPERIAAISAFNVEEPDVAVLHIQDDARETVWGSVDDIERILGLCGQRNEWAAQVSLDERVHRAQRDTIERARLKNAVSLTGPEEHAG